MVTRVCIGSFIRTMDLTILQTNNINISGLSFVTTIKNFKHMEV